MDTRLHEAVRYGDLNGTIAALNAGFSPNDVGLFQWTPVQEAAHNGERDILFHLLSNGGHPNIQDTLHGNTAMHYATIGGHLDCVHLLLQNKGNPTLCNTDGKTCLDVASPSCREAVAKLVMEFGGDGGEEDERNNNERKMIRRPTPADSDKWSTLPEVPKQAAMGYLHLSFEFHKGTLKVRVWQISDLLLPPPQISMIYSIFVRGYFIPDKARKTHRRTEDVLVDLTDRNGSETAKSGIQHIFTPSSFKFRNPLLYTGVTADIIKERSLQLEVCMTQKQSHRTFLMAMVHMPLRVAVRRPIREKYPLIPCMNITIPNNMRVYSATELQLESSKGRKVKSKDSTANNLDSAIPLSARTPREIDLEDVVSLSGEDFLRSHLSLCLDEDSEDENSAGKAHLQEVRVSNGVGSGGSSSTTLNMPSSDDDCDDDNSIPYVVTEGTGKYSDSSSIDLSHAETSSGSKLRKKIIPNEILQQEMSDDVALEMPADEVIVDMDVSHSDGQPDTSASSGDPALQDNTLSPSPDSTLSRKKIIPNEIGLDLNTSPRKDDGSHLISSSESQIPDETFSRDNVKEEEGPVKKEHQSLSAVPKKKKITVLPDELVPSETIRHSTHSSTGSDVPSPRDITQSQLSPNLQDSPFTPASRPETPCWDFYDFDEPLQQDDDPDAVNLTLDQSLVRLQQLGLSSQNVSMEPILPMVLVDDFDTLTAESEQTS